MESIQGRPIPPEVRKLIVTVKYYFDRNKSEIRKTDSSVQLTADAFAIGIATVKRVMADYNRDPEFLEKPPSYRGRPDFAVSASNEEKVRSYIRQANQKGQCISLTSIRDFLLENSSVGMFHISTLSRTLDRWGFTFGKGTRTQRFKEKDHVIAARRRYLRKKRSNRDRKDNSETIRPEVYLDESYVNKNHSNDFIWYSGDDCPLVQKPTGKGERLIIINAITKHGWVPGAKLVFKSTRKTGDYHGQMNWDLFLKWFTEKLMPNIPKNSLIVMDNAAYHNILSKYSAPTPACSKAKIIAWLEQNKVYCEQDCLKSELVELLKKLAPEPTYAIDEIARENGHEILRTPPYHPELQPIVDCQEN
jgi:transposase